MSNTTLTLANLFTCTKESRRWFVYVVIDFCIYIIGLIILLIKRYIYKAYRRRLLAQKEEADDEYDSKTRLKFRKRNKARENACLRIMKKIVTRCVSTQYSFGRGLLLISTIASFVSLFLYLYEMFQVYVPLERCEPLKNPIFIIDIVCNMIFLLHFIVRFLGTTEKLVFWVNPYTITDIFTIPQIVASIFLNREWTGLRFLRVIGTNRLQSVLQSFNLIESSTWNRVVELSTTLLAIWILGAGSVHLFENSGNAILEATQINKYFDVHDFPFGDCLYFIVVTLSTVGYGDYGTKTIAGKIFITVFILVALALFASYIPEFAEYISSRSRYLGIYKKESGVMHVVVCGNINYDSALNFLVDFFHEDRANRGIEVVFLNKEQPSVEMKALLKLYFTRVKYFQGTVMNQDDLERVQMNRASGCLVLANQISPDPDNEDSGNIMRVISLKNQQPSCPIVIQLLKFDNRVYLEKIPNWDTNIGDHIVCYSEIELGILAQSCMVPGFSTLLTNIYSVRSDKDHELLDMQSDWILNYLRGVSMEIYSAKLSRSFEGMPYKEVVEFCFKNLNLLLIALELIDGDNNRLVMINPLNLKHISYGTIGYFICDSYKDARNAKIYCNNCHAGNHNLKRLKKCHCGKVKKEDAFANPNPASNVSMFMLNALGSFDENDPGHRSSEDYEEGMGNIIRESMENLIETEPTKSKIIGDFYCCENQKLSRCVINDESQSNELNNHIIMCIFSDDSSQSIGMKSFLMPLRTTTLPEDEIKVVLIIAEKPLIENEWPEICMFPKIKVVYQQYSLKKIINLIGIERCSRCVLLNSNSDYDPDEKDLYMVDKDVIIANLYFQAESRKKMRENIMNCKVIPMKSDSDKENKEYVSIKMNERNQKADIEESIGGLPIMSKLSIESNVQFLDTNSEVDKSLPIYVRKPFAFGCVFTANNLDSLMSTAFFSPSSMKIMEMLITGGCFGNDDESFYNKSINRFRIMLIEVTKLNKTLKWTPESTIFYRELFLEALNKYNYLVLGLYRKLELDNNSDSSSKSSHDDRYVFTNPPPTLPIDRTDLIYCILNENLAKPPDQKTNDASSSFPPMCEVENL